MRILPWGSGEGWRSKSMQRNTMLPGLQNFRVAMPPQTHRIAATCAEVDCTHYLGGWLTVVAIGSRQDLYIRTHSGRKWTCTKIGENALEYRFEPGQRCFREHTRLSGRPPFYLYETAEGRRVHQPQDFMEHAHEEIKKSVGLEER